ncbi:MAG: type II toxin-antitoxin system RelE/ParE family toxin [Planctomycetes bacterium]|nr:type II toxin-antitoxin system RelE/ParE family toxin [Planctomycetota bacterium]
MITVRFHRLASRELKLAQAWYRARDLRVGDSFLAAVDAGAERIALDPDSFPIERALFRAIRIQGFPYRLIFERCGVDQVLVIAVAHTSRRPGYWSRRTL